MKKIYFVYALFAALSIVSCVQNEEFDNGVNLSENGIAFRFGTATRATSSVVSEGVETGLSIALGDTKSGSRIYLRETVEDLNAYSPMTKGAPVYHENLMSLKEQGYDQINVATYLEGGAEHTPGNAVYDSEDQEGGTGGWLYIHSYATTPWPDPDQSVYFFLNMPASSNATNLTYDSDDGLIEFDYESPATAPAQKDILFGARTMTKNQYNENYKTTGAPVTLYHALTGVKFRVGNNNDNDTKTIITGVTFSGLYGKGHAVFDSSDGSVEWAPTVGSEADFSVSFDNPTYNEESDNSIDFISGENNAFGDSWYTGGTASKPYNKDNLNAEDGSLTFWLIPQAFANHLNVTMEISYLIKTPDTPNGISHTETINLTKVLGESSEGHPATVWKAGQLRTYTLEPRAVDVEIEDEMEGYVKSDLHVANTGNVDEYVRMLVIGNWYGWESEQDYLDKKEPDILVGYKYRGDETTFAPGEDANTMTRAWFRGDDIYGDGFDASFKFGNPGNGSKWIKAHGGYYYPDPIGPGEKMEFEEQASQSAKTTPLFESYTLDPDWIPVIWIPDPASDLRRQAYGVHLVMEIVVQAISTKDQYGEPFSDYQAAWIDATGDPNYFD